ncbi:hypothetical protein ACFQ8C_33450 [Streptomyces sp. NPDC056503]|uniref:hypothetical protein n=1 Tax=Streptomyces sp. NPDC056503 TaxID=3345842 RepID=UPI0036A65F2E
MPSAPPAQAPPVPAPPAPEATAHGGHPRHAAPSAPAPRDPRGNAHGAGGAEPRPDHTGSARPDTGADAEGIPELLAPAEEERFRGRWHEVQGRFVDDPRQAVHAADVLVGDVMRTLADTFALHRQTLESQWSQGLEADTESLRRALCQYRALFHRLLST